MSNQSHKPLTDEQLAIAVRHQQDNQRLSWESCERYARAIRPSEALKPGEFDIALKYQRKDPELSWDEAEKYARMGVEPPPKAERRAGRALGSRVQPNRQPTEAENEKAIDFIRAHPDRDWDSALKYAMTDE